MAELTYKDIAFQEDGEGFKGILYNLYAFPIPTSDLASLGEHRLLDRHTFSFPKVSQEKAERRFSLLLGKWLKGLYLQMNKTRAVYIHRDSGVPLLGSNYFGLVDRDTNVIEVKPMTGCNLNCIYCSVDEGRNSSKVMNYIIEEEYVVEGFKELVALKGSGRIEAHIGGQADPSIYARLPDLVRDLRAINGVETVSIDTNGLMMAGNLKYTDELLEAGLNRINLSLNAIDPDVATKVAGTPYPVGKVQELAGYLASRIKLIIAPTLLPGINEDEMPKIIGFAKTISTKERTIPVRIQNFLEYAHGRNPVKSKSFDWFFEKLRVWEKEKGVKLTMDDDDTFFFEETKVLPKTMKRGQIVDIELLFPGRRKGEMLGKANDRIISLPGCTKKEGVVRGKIVRTKHNIYTAKVI